MTPLDHCPDCRGDGFLHRGSAYAPPEPCPRCEARDKHDREMRAMRVDRDFEPTELERGFDAEYAAPAAALPSTWDDPEF